MHFTSFTELYNYVESLGELPISFNMLQARIEAYHRRIGRVQVIEIPYPELDGQAYYRQVMDHSSGYGPEFILALIVHCESLASDQKWLRLYLTKELMQVFDSPEEQAGTPEKVRQLLQEIEDDPAKQHASAQYLSDLDAKWMAVLILCPKPFRDELLDQYRSGEISDYDVAKRFEVPEEIAPTVMGEYYDDAYNRLIAGNDQ